MSRVTIVAEAGVNHNGSVDTACRLVEHASEAGADVVKFQTFQAERIISRSAKKAPYQAARTKPSQSQLEMLKELELKEDDFAEVASHCQKCGIEFLSTPFDLESVKLLVQLGVKRIKLPSGEITNFSLLFEAAKTALPLIVSTGMSTIQEIEDALGVIAFAYLQDREPCVQAFRNAYRNGDALAFLQERVTLLHCTTEYPAPFNEVNLRAMQTLSERTKLNVGYSDHTPGIHVPVAAVALGARIVEKHLTCDRWAEGPDHQMSLEPGEFAEMVRAIRDSESALGSAKKEPASSELKNISVVRKSLIAARNIQKGEKFTPENLTTKRPGTGISASHYFDFLGRKSQRDYCEDDFIADCLE